MLMRLHGGGGSHSPPPRQVRSLAAPLRLNRSCTTRVPRLSTKVITTTWMGRLPARLSAAPTQAREAALQLATPAVQEIPIPEPAPEGQPETWMPLGVWALTQQEQG